MNKTNNLACLLQEVHIPRLITPAEKGRDLEPRVIDAYIIQCQAEAQEGKVAPALATIKLYTFFFVLFFCFFCNN